MQLREKISGVLQILKNIIGKKISGVLQIMHLELIFSRAVSTELTIKTLVFWPGYDFIDA